MEKPNKTSWQDKRIKAMDRVISGNAQKHQHYIDEYCAIINSKAKNKKLNEYLDRDKIYEEYYINGCVHTPYDRVIPVDQEKAVNYLIQSTTADLVLDRAVEVDKMLEGKKSFVSHIVHDELVIDMADEDREMVPGLRDLFADNKVDKYLVNLRAGKNYLDLKDLNL